jgi:hypothetical protein
LYISCFSEEEVWVREWAWGAAAVTAVMIDTAVKTLIAVMDLNLTKAGIQMRYPQIEMRTLSISGKINIPCYRSKKIGSQKQWIGKLHIK